MKETAVIVVLLALFASSHMLLSSRTVRTGLVARLGDKRFLAAYSLVATALFVPLVYYTSRIATRGRIATAGRHQDHGRWA